MHDIVIPGPFRPTHSYLAPNVNSAVDENSPLEQAGSFLNTPQPFSLYSPITGTCRAKESSPQSPEEEKGTKLERAMVQK